MAINKSTMLFNVLIKKIDDKFLAHCLELDIVTTAKTLNQVRQDIIDLIKAQVSFAYENDNLAHLFKPAPKEVWEEYFRVPTGKIIKVPKPKAPAMTVATSSVVSLPTFGYA